MGARLKKVTSIQWHPEVSYNFANSSDINICDGFINIWEGAVRSSKTVASLVAWKDFLFSCGHKEFLMTGKTADTLYRNVLGGDFGLLNIINNQLSQDKKIFEYAVALYGAVDIHDLTAEDWEEITEAAMLEMTPDDYKEYAVYSKSSDGGAKVTIGEITIYCLGANDERAEGNVRGMTIGGWYADEVTLYPENFVKQAINRMSLAGARAFWTCNPDSPYHYIYTEFIEQAEKKGYRVFHFELDDNCSLTQAYKDNLKNSYSGLWYKRMIQGLWVMADGVIYNLFNHETHVISIDKLPDMLRYWVGVDYGTSNATTFILVGLGADGNFYVISEFYHSGKEEQQKSPSLYAIELEKWLDKQKTPQGGSITPEKIYIDPSAEGFILECYNKGIRRIQKADNAVKSGIELVSNIMGKEKFYVVKTCKNVLRELSSYVWDSKAQKLGEDKPIKQNDHCLDPIRYVANGTRTIWQNRKAA